MIKHHVAIVYHFYAHYRQPILKLLSRQSNPEYTFYSDGVGNIPSMKTIDPGLASIPVSAGGIRWCFISNIWLLPPLLWQVGLIRLAFSRKFKTIIYLGNMYFLSTWISCLLARLVGKRTLMWTHGFLKDENGFKGFLRTLFFRLPHGLLLYGNRSREICIAKGFRSESLYVVFNSLDYNEQIRVRESITDTMRSEFRENLFRSPEKPLLVWVGRLTEPKHLDMILQALPLLKKFGDEPNVLFVGDGPAYKALKRLAEELGVADRVKFTGSCYDEEKLGLSFSSADISVAPGSIGLMCIHSMMYGTPVITHNVIDRQKPEFEAIVPGMTGKLFQYGDVEDLACVIHEWLLLPLSRERVEKHCHRIVDRYYNPVFQKNIINAAVAGVPAMELRGIGMVDSDLERETP